jgi:CheY-like chemotaxis protein
VWQKQKDRIQLLLTDIVMPGNMPGYELARQLQAEKPQLKIIYTSGYSEDLADKRLRLMEGVNFLQKPYAPQQLAEALRKTLDPK